MNETDVTNPGVGGSNPANTRETQDSGHPVPGRTLMLAVLVGTHIMSNMFRSVPAITATSWQAELQLSTDALGLVSAAYFITFALFQLPGGVLLDRFGPRRVVGLTFGFTAIGSLLAILADGFWLLFLSQLMIGLGCATSFMGVLVFVARSWSQGRFTQVSGYALTGGNTGYLLTGAPSAFAIANYGWQSIFIVSGLCALGLCVLILLIVRDTPPDREQTAKPPEKPPAETLGRIFRGLWRTVSNRRMLGILALANIFFATSLAVRSLWIGPYFDEIYGLSLSDVGHVVAAMSVAFIIGPAISGELDRRWQNPPAQTSLGAVLTIIPLLWLALAGGWSLPVDIAAFVALPLVGSLYFSQYGEVKAMVPASEAGRTLTTLNLCVFGGVGLWQAGTAMVATAVSDSEQSFGADAFSAVFFTLAIGLGLALTLYRWLTYGGRKPPPAGQARS